MTINLTPEQRAKLNEQAAAIVNGEPFTIALTDEQVAAAEAHFGPGALGGRRVECSVGTGGGALVSPGATTTPVMSAMQVLRALNSGATTFFEPGSHTRYLADAAGPAADRLAELLTRAQHDLLLDDGLTVTDRPDLIEVSRPGVTWEPDHAEILREIDEALCGERPMVPARGQRVGGEAAPTWAEDGDRLRCSTGAALPANQGLLSVSASGQLFSGYDDTWPDDDVRLTPPERRALAEFMIARWRKWAAR